MDTPEADSGVLAGPDIRPAAERAGGLNQIQLAGLTAVLAGMLAAGTYLGSIGLLVAVAVVQAILIPSWVLGGALPGRIGAIVLGVLAAAGADVTTMHWHDSGYAPVLGVLGLAIPLMFAHQLTRGVVRSRVVESMAGITLLVVAVVALSGLIVLRYQGNGQTITLALIGALGTGLVVDHLADTALPAPRFDPGIDRGLPGLLAGMIVGGAVGLLVLRNDIDFTGGRGVFIGAAIAAVACLLSIAASFAESRGMATVAGDRPAVSVRAAKLRPVAAVALTIALTAPAGYVLINALTS